MIVSTTPRPLHLACVASVAATVMLALQCSSGDAKQTDNPIENTDVTDPSERIGAFPVIEDDAADSGGPSARVLDDATGKPIAGVLVFSMTRSGTPLGKRSTGADGTATGLPGMKRIYGLVAWHKDYELGGFVLGPGGADLRLKPATYLSVEIGASPGASPTDVNLEWHAACDTYLTYSCDLIGNPVSSGGDYLAYRVFLKLGLNHHKWPVSGGKSEVPRYLINSGMLKLWSKSKLPNHLDRSGLLSPTPLAAKREPVELEKQNLKRATTETSMMPKPHGEHLLVMRYKRSAEQTGKTMMIHLAAKHDGELRNFETDYSTFDQRSGTTTFKVFEVTENTYHPTLLFLEDGKPLQKIKCMPIPVAGRTDVMLVAKPN